jgi:hypothetical protein
MKHYKRFYTEEDTNNNGVPDWYDKKVSAFIRVLRDENFGSEEQRKKMLDILTSLHNSSDKRARLLFKKIGEHLTEIGDELIRYGRQIGED